MPPARTEVRIAGAGGQGVVTAGRVLAEAVILSGRNATHSQVYGPESRGGASRSDVVIADGEIGFPVAEGLDVLVALSSLACERYSVDLRERALLVVDESLVPDPPAGPWERCSLAIVDAARRVAGNPKVTGVVAVGALARLTGIVESEALERAVEGRFPPDRREVNLRALAAGAELTRGA